jgi:hypothetical protein
VQYDSVARAEVCGNFGSVVPGQGVTYSCNPNYSAGMAGIVTRWTPVKNFTFSGEVGWFGLHQQFSGTGRQLPGVLLCGLPGG